MRPTPLVLAFAALAPTVLVLAVRSGAAAPPPAQAADGTARSLTVSASESVLVPPGALKLDVLVKKNAELTEQAVADHGQSLAQLRSAFEQAELPGLELRRKGLRHEYVPEPMQADNQMRNVIMSSSGSELLYGVTLKEAVEVRFRSAGDAEVDGAAAVRALDTLIELGLELEDPPSGNNNYMYINGRRVNIGQSAVEGVLDDEAVAEAERAAQDAAYAAALARATRQASAVGMRLGPPLEVTLQSLEQAWGGLGEGVEVTARLAVEFELLP